MSDLVRSSEPAPLEGLDEPDGDEPLAVTAPVCMPVCVAPALEADEALLRHKERQFRRAESAER